MISRFSILLFVISLSLIVGCEEDKSTSATGAGVISIDSLVAAVQILSSDSFQGRKPFTKGEEITVNYLRQKFISLGLEPGNGNSYFQDVPMVNIQATASPTMRVTSAKGSSFK